MELTKYDEKEAGGIMTTDYFEVDPSWNVKKVIQFLRRHKEEVPSVTYVYVTTQGKLVGVISLRELLLASQEEKVKNIMVTNLFTVLPDFSLQQVAHLLTKYNLYSLAVVDDAKQLLGVIMVDDVMREFFPEA